jgi:hypothetical protein
MKERTNAKNYPLAADADEVVELTQEMALDDQSQAVIIELTDPIDGPAESSETPQQPATQPVIEDTEPEEEADLDSDQPLQSADIEDQVDAAFETAQIESAEQTKAAAQKEQLLDRLSDIPHMVDNAVQETGAATQEVQEPAAEPEFDSEQLTRDAALIDVAMAPGEPDEEIIELTDIVDPAELDPEAQRTLVAPETGDEDADLLDPAQIVTPETSQAQVPAELSVEVVDADDDDIIELTDIVDPAELQVPAQDEAAEIDDDIIELTDIVDPADLEPGIKMAPIALDTDLEDDDLLGLTDIVEPKISQTTTQDAPPADAIDQAADDIIELTDIIDPAKIDPSIPFSGSAPSDSDDQVLSLTDVLDKRPKKDGSAEGDAPAE